MALKVSFGQGAKPTQWYLPGTNTALLPAGPARGQPPVADALTDGPYAPAWDDTPLFGGLVEADTVGGTGHSFDVVGGWNSVKNAFAQSDQAEELRFDGFVQVDIDVGRADPGGDSLITVIGAKRGNIVTGAGDDIIRVELLSNEANWVNEFRVSAGDGHDVVTITGLDRDRELAGGDMTYASFVNTSGVWNTSGDTTKTFIDLGAGNDRFIGHGSDDTVTGGTGNDLADGGGGSDTWVLSGLRAGYTFTYAAGRWLITDIDASDGDDGRDDIGGFETVRFGDGSEMTLASLPLPEGLTLWNRLGDAGEVAASEIGPDGTLAGGSFVPGVFGGAWRATSAEATPDANVVVPIKGVSFPSSVINAASGTIEFWARLEGFSGGMGVNAHPGLITDAPAAPGNRGQLGHWNMGFTGNDGGGGYGLVGQVGGGNLTGTNARFSPPTFEEILGGRPEDWHHFALSWNSDGFASLGQPDREVMLFLNGVAVSSHWEERVAFIDENGELAFGSAELVEPYGETLVLAFTSGPGWPAGSAISFDNLKVWSGAKTDFSDRFDEDAGAPPPTDTGSLTFVDIANGVGGFMVIGDGRAKGVGEAIAAVGDQNGDGVGDLLIGAPYHDGGAYVVFGKADGVPVRASELEGFSDRGTWIDGENWSDYAGDAVAAIGDQNGDGRDDLLIGAPEHSIYDPGDLGGPPRHYIGAGYVVWEPGASLGGIAHGSGSGTKATGPFDFALMGHAVGAIGDLDGDGRDEPLFSAPTLGDDPAMVFVGDLFRVESLAGSIGSSLGSIGDVNGDGRPEVLIGGYDGAYVVWGKSDDATVLIDESGDIAGGFRIVGAGWNISSTGDMNGDGLQEILASGFVIWGKGDDATVDVADVAAGVGGFAVPGASHLASLGTDLNNDGVIDLLAATADATYVIWGKADTAPVDLDAVGNGMGGFKVFGEGGAPIAAGDMNGDGLPELLFGEPSNSVGSTYGGAAFVVFSTASWLHEG